MSIMSHIRRLLGHPRTKPVTMNDVSAAKQDPAKELEIRKATGELVGNVMSVERSAYEVREALATGALRLVGDK
jgi:hypothetical protein